MKKRTKKGFTLIELIVVIAILAILSAIAIPVVSGVVDNAHTSANKANQRTIELAAKVYITEGNSISNDATLGSALSEFGLSSPIDGSTVSYTVSSSGAVTQGSEASPGAISYQ
ncbi:MAG TPA: type II secretion system protein [Anaerovoracaceae bacterium]|nr:type II secretion system protein [Anaerovoracaceae bacterium]